MADIKPIGNAADLFQRINRLAGEADWTEAELKEAFVAEGIDPSSLLEATLADVKRHLRESPLHWLNRAKALRSQLQASMIANERRRSEKLPRKQLLGNIEATLARMPPNIAQQLSFAHRNFENCSDEDLESILAELEYIANLDESKADE